VAHVVSPVVQAGVTGPRGGLRASAEAFNGALHAATRAAGLLLARASRHAIYVIVAAHLHGALERSMSSGSARVSAGGGGTEGPDTAAQTQ
jgi:hypothetical protein